MSRFRFHPADSRWTKKTFTHRNRYARSGDKVTGGGSLVPSGVVPRVMLTDQHCQNVDARPGDRIILYEPVAGSCISLSLSLSVSFSLSLAFSLFLSLFLSDLSHRFTLSLGGGQMPSNQAFALNGTRLVVQQNSECVSASPCMAGEAAPAALCITAEACINSTATAMGDFHQQWGWLNGTCCAVKKHPFLTSQFAVHSIEISVAAVDILLFRGTHLNTHSIQRLVCLSRNKEAAASRSWRRVFGHLYMPRHRFEY